MDGAFNEKGQEGVKQKLVRSPVIFTYTYLFFIFWCQKILIFVLLSKLLLEKVVIKFNITIYKIHIIGHISSVFGDCKIFIFLVYTFGLI